MNDIELVGRQHGRRRVVAATYRLLSAGSRGADAPKKYHTYNVSSRECNPPPNRKETDVASFNERTSKTEKDAVAKAFWWLVGTAWVIVVAAILIVVGQATGQFLAWMFGG